MSNVRRLVNNTPDKASSLEDFIAAGEDTAVISYYNYSILQVEFSTDKSIELHFTIDNLINDYLDIFRDNAIKVPLNDLERRKYYYNPDLLAYDIYGSVELDFVILAINGIIDPKEFNLPKVKLLKKQDLISILSRIYNAESRYLAKNRSLNGLNMPGY